MKPDIFFVIAWKLLVIGTGERYEVLSLEIDDAQLISLSFFHWLLLSTLLKIKHTIANLNTQLKLCSEDSKEASNLLTG